MYLGCALTAKAEEPALCNYQVCSILLICTVLPSMISCRITLLCVAILLLSMPRREETGCTVAIQVALAIVHLSTGCTTMPCCIQARGTERFMVHCKLEHVHVPLS